MTDIRKLREKAEQARIKLINNLGGAERLADAIIAATLAKLAVQKAEKKALFVPISKELMPEVQKIVDEREGWIEWHGGECPVNLRTKVTIKLREGFKNFPGGVPAGHLLWKHLGGNSDIIAYRIVKTADRVEES